jgi:hypothetical protein
VKSPAHPRATDVCHSHDTGRTKVSRPPGTGAAAATPGTERDDRSDGAVTGAGAASILTGGVKESRGEKPGSTRNEREDSMIRASRKKRRKPQRRPAAFSQNSRHGQSRPPLKIQQAIRIGRRRTADRVRYRSDTNDAGTVTRHRDGLPHHDRRLPAGRRDRATGRDGRGVKAVTSRGPE